MTIGIVVFPGSNCDRDVFWALSDCLGINARFLWHESTDLSGLDAIVLPGGFSYGDYLRCGAIARYAPIFDSINEFVHCGGKLLGICNGFQILTELQLLPGALTRNVNLNFICSNVSLKVSTTRSKWFENFNQQQIINLPIAHGEGRFQCSDDTLKKLLDDDCVALTYENNLNGSIHSIAALTNKRGNILGMMPHPERACDNALGGIDGIQILKSLVGS